MTTNMSGLSYTHSGYLDVKQVSFLNRNVSYKRRWFLLVLIKDEPYLLQFEKPIPKADTSSNPFGLINLTLSSIENYPLTGVTAKGYNNDTLQFILESGTGAVAKQSTFRAETGESVDVWIKGINFVANLRILSDEKYGKEKVSISGTWRQSLQSLPFGSTFKTPTPAAGRGGVRSEATSRYSISSMFASKPPPVRNQNSDASKSLTLPPIPPPHSSSSTLHHRLRLRSVELDLKFLSRNRLENNQRRDNQSKDMKDDDVFIQSINSMNYSFSSSNDVYSTRDSTIEENKGTHLNCSPPPNARSASVSFLPKDEGLEPSTSHRMRNMSVETMNRLNNHRIQMIQANKQTSADSGVPTRADPRESYSDESACEKTNSETIARLENEIKESQIALKLSKERQRRQENRLLERDVALNDKTMKLRNLEEKEKKVIERDFQKNHLNNLVKSVSCIECKTHSSSDLYGFMSEEYHRLKRKSLILTQCNEFLAEEVKRMCDMRLSSNLELQNLSRQVHDTNMKHLKLKCDYSHLLLNTVSDETNCLLYQYTSERLELLLEEAFTFDPSLPNFRCHGYARFHVDKYGFRHSIQPEYDYQLYASHRLVMYYEQRLELVNQNCIKWRQWMTEMQSDRQKFSKKEMKSMSRKGIPEHLRSQIWPLIIRSKIKTIIAEKIANYYDHLCQNLGQIQVALSKQICSDLLKTCTTNLNFNSLFSTGIIKLERILKAFCLHNPDLSYCRGFSHMAALMLLVTGSEEEAFWSLVFLTDVHFPINYFDNEKLIGPQADKILLKQLLHDHLPDLSDHLRRTKTDIGPIVLQWFSMLYVNLLPIETALRIWDCLLIEGTKVILRFALSILKMAEKSILLCHDTFNIWKTVKNYSCRLYNADYLCSIAFGSREDFPRKCDLLARQTCFINSLRDSERQHHTSLQIQSKNDPMEDDNSEITNSTTYSEVFHNLFTKRSSIFRANSPNSHVDCTTQSKSGDIFIALREVKSISEIYRLNGAMNNFESTKIKIDQQILCLIVNHSCDQIIVGCTNGDLLSFDINGSFQRWIIQLGEPILDMLQWFFPSDSFRCDEHAIQLVVGLGDGHIVFIDKSNSLVYDGEDNYPLSIGDSEVRKLLQVSENQIWCSMGTSITAVDSRTLSVMGQNDISEEVSEERIEAMILDERNSGVWLGMIGSFKIYLLDIATYSSKLVYDLRNTFSTNSCLPADSFGITALLSVDTYLWVGTRQGHILVLLCDSPAHLYPQFTQTGHHLPSYQIANPTSEEKVSEFLQKMSTEEWLSSLPPSELSEQEEVDSKCESQKRGVPLSQTKRKLIRYETITSDNEEDEETPLEEVTDLEESVNHTTDFFGADEISSMENSHETILSSSNLLEHSSGMEQPARRISLSSEKECVVGPPLSLMLRYQLANQTSIKGILGMRFEGEDVHVITVAATLDKDSTILMWQKQMNSHTKVTVWVPEALSINLTPSPLSLTNFNILKG